MLIGMDSCLRRNDGGRGLGGGVCVGWLRGLVCGWFGGCGMILGVNALCGKEMIEIGDGT